MKKSLFLSLLLSLVAIVAQARTEINGIAYNLDEGTLTASVASKSEKYSGSVDIPSSVDYSGKTYAVTSIGASAFRDCSGLTSVTIPNSVTNIGEAAFYFCNGLTAVNITDLTAWCSISFKDNPLSYAHHLFLNGTEVKDLVIPDGVTTIGGSAFNGCSGLTSVSIPDGVTFIGDEAFYGCSKLTSVTIPNSVTSIGNQAFSACTGLTSVTIPNSVTSIGKNPFSRCSSLTAITVDKGNQKYDSRDNCNAIIETEYNALIAGCKNTQIPDGMIFIEDAAFSGCKGLTSVTIPGSVTFIGNYAFNGCTGLTSVEIPNSVTSIGNYAFNGCTGLTSVEIPSSVTSIGNGAFSGCTGLTSVTIPSSVTFMGYSAFSSCSNLTSVSIGNSVTSIGESAFRDCSGLTSVEIPNSVTSIGKFAFYECTGLTSVSIPNSVTSIEWSAFYGCSSLTSVSIPNSVTSIGWSAFYGCSSLTSVSISGSVIDIQENAFDRCNINTVTVNYIESLRFFKKYGSTVRTINLGNGVETIPNGSFDDFSGITSLTIPASVKSIEDKAFNNCSSIQELTLNCKLIQDWFSSVKSSVQKLTLGNGVETIGYHALYGFSAITSVTIPSSVTSIGKEAFSGCSGLTAVNITDLTAWCSISFKDNPLSYAHHLFLNGTEVKDLVIPDGVTTIGGSAFDGCSALTSLTIPASVKSIEDKAFNNCSSIQELTLNCKLIQDWFSSVKSSVQKLTLGNGVETIGYHAFYGFSAITSVTIPSSVTSIGKEAFYECNSIRKVYSLSENPCSIENSFTENVYKRAILYVPNGCKSIYRSTAGWNLFGNVVEFDPEILGVDAVKGNDEAAESAFYTLDGKQLQQKRRGLQIVRMSDGKVRKVFVK